MKIEKINNNQIRCILSMKDLEERNITMKELVFTTEKTKKLFAEVIDAAHKQFGFSNDADALMVEATPTDKEEINIIITKAGAGTKSLRELIGSGDMSKLLNGADFAKLMGSADMSKMMNGADPAKLFSGADIGKLFKTVTDIIKNTGGAVELPAVTFDDMNKVDASEALETIDADKALTEEKPSQQMPTTTDQSSKPKKKAPKGKAVAQQKDVIRAYIYDSKEAALAALKVIAKSFSGENSLYLKTKTGTYFLVVHKGEMEATQFNKICNVLTEYGAQVKPDYCSENYFREHYQIVASPNAIEALINS